MAEKPIDFEKIVTTLIEKARSDGKVFETRKVEFKREYALNGSGGKINKAVQAELIRDVASLANSLPDPELETGLLILGVDETGNITEDYKLPVSDVAKLTGIINGVLDRAVTFYYREYRIFGKKVGTIIIPRSSFTPHIVKNAICENEATYLRSGECWTRAEGGKKLAMATDFDEMYEYANGINKFERVQSRKKLTATAKRKKTPTQAEKVEEVLNLGNEDLNEKIKKMLK